MNIEELTEEYKDKLDKLQEEYIEKINKLQETKEEPFIRKGQKYYYIDGRFHVFKYKYNNDIHDNNFISVGNCYPFTDETNVKVLREVSLIAERRKLQSEMEMFARQNNEGEIDWNDGRQDKYYLYIDYTENNIRKGYALSSRHFNTVYFTSEETAKKALEKFGDRIRELYLKQEEQ